MRKLLLAAVLALSVPTTSQAIVSLGLRLGVGFPAGDLSKANLYKDNITNQVPVQVDVMFGAPSLQLGLYVGYAYNKVNDAALSALPPGTTATSGTLRAGLQATSELVDLGLIGIWAGLGTGYEAAQLKADTSVGTFRATYRGWEFVTVSAGADLKFIPLISLGLYGSAGFGQFGAMTLETPGGTTAGGLGPDKAIHQMYTVGLRGALNL